MGKRMEKFKFEYSKDKKLLYKFQWRNFLIGRKDSRQSYSDTLASPFGPPVNSSVVLFFILETFSSICQKIYTILPNANKTKFRTNVTIG